MSIIHQHVSFRNGSKAGFVISAAEILCNEGCRDGAQRAGATSIIPEEAEKPRDARIKSGKYIKLKKEGELK